MEPGQRIAAGAIGAQILLTVQVLLDGAEQLRLRASLVGRPAQAGVADPDEGDDRRDRIQEEHQLPGASR